MLRALILFFCAIPINIILSQPLVLKITSSSNKIYEFNLKNSYFGPVVLDTISAPIKFSNHILGCSNENGVNSITNNLAGSIAIIERGNCSFQQKSINAQKRNALAVIICNTETGNFINPGGFAYGIDIPFLMIEKNSCDTLKYLLSNEIISSSRITIESCKTKIKYPYAIFGNQISEGDFSNGIGNWTVTNGWEYLQFGNTLGYYSKGYVNTTSVCNGAMIFNSDFLDNAGEYYNNGGGSCPSPCVGSLISPNILLPKKIDSLVLRFDQGVRHFESEYMIAASYDNGITWPDTINVNSLIETNNPHLNETLNFYLDFVPQNSEQIRIQFVHVGNYYYWAIDDVFMLNIPTSKLVIPTLNNWGLLIMFISMNIIFCLSLQQTAHSKNVD